MTIKGSLQVNIAIVKAF